jgi:putative ABC transport system permease protein
MLQTLLPDIRSAIRSLTHARGFTGTVVATLGAGLALSIVVLTIVNAYLVRALPYPAADRLYSVQYSQPGGRDPRGMESLDWASLSDIVEHPIAWDLDAFYLLGGEYPQSTPGAWVTPGFVAGLGIRAAIGRGFEPSDFEAGRPVVALISHRLWQSRFGGDVNVIGRRFNAYVSDRPEEPESFEIVGVLPDNFWHLNPYTDVLTPLKAPTYPYMVRLRSGVPAGLAADRMTRLVRAGSGGLSADWQARLVSTQNSYTATVRPVLFAVTAAAGLVLLIACANIAVLLLVRATRRERELTLRVALGASRWRVVRLVVFEALVLGAAATALGLLLCAFTFDLIAPLVEQFLERRVPGGVSTISLTPAVVAAAACGGLAATALCVLAPMLVAWRQAGAPFVAAGNRSAGEGASRGRLRLVLIGVEVAVSLTLLTGSALMTVTALRMLAVDFGIDANVAMASLALRQQSYPNEAARAGFYERCLSQLESSLPAGRRFAALNDWWPMQQARPRRVEAETAAASADAGVMSVTAQYFATLAIPIREGRSIASQDRLGGEKVAVISRSLAKRLWPDGPAVGRQMRLQNLEGSLPSATAPMVTYTIVGVAGDVRQSHADQNLFDVYLSLLQNPGRFAYVFLPAPTQPVPVASVVASIDQEVAVGTPRLLSELVDQERAKPRFLAYMLSGFALFAGVLAMLGMYGVIAYAVRQREREIAVRMAVGASHGSVTWLFVRQGGLVLAAGTLAGLAGAVGMGRLLDAQLYGVGRSDPRVIAAAAFALAVGGLVAIWWPASRAAQTDPATALKVE